VRKRRKIYISCLFC